MTYHHRIQVHIEKMTHDILDLVERLPKKYQFLFGKRISELVLDSLMLAVKAQFTPPSQQTSLLHHLDECLLQIRILLRLCADRKLISLGQLESTLHRMDTCIGLLESWKQEIPSTI